MLASWSREVRGDWVPEDALGQDREGVGKWENTLGVALAIPLGTDVLVLELLVPVCDLHVDDDVLQLFHLRPDLRLEYGVATGGGDHHVAVQTKLGAPGEVKVTEVSWKKVLCDGFLFPPLAIDWSKEMVGVAEVLDLQHPRGEDKGEAEGDYQEDHGIPRYLLPEFPKQTLEKVIQ